MSHLSNLFRKGAVLTPKRSGYDLSHENLFTAMCGTLTPCYVEDVIGNTNISINTAFNVVLPPLATDFFGRVDACVEFFFCPTRLTYGGYEYFYTQTKTIGANSNLENSSSFIGTDTYALPSSQPTVFDHLPYHKYSGAVMTSITAPGTLMDYLGMKNFGNTIPTGTYNIPNLTSAIAYHLIWQTYYRRPNLEAPAFVVPSLHNSATNNLIKYWPYVRWSSDNAQTITSLSAQELILNDGKSIFDLRQRHYDYDYFTSALPSPTATSLQTGEKSGAFVIAKGNTNDDDTAFSISALRAANTLAQFLDRQAVTSWRYSDNALSKTGCRPPELATEPLYLGRVVAPIYNNTIKSSSPSVNYDGTSTVNTSSQPWSGTGSRVASPTASGASHIVKNFHAKENGIVMGIFSLVPHSYYSSGTRRYLQRSTITDFPDALLQNAGMQKISQQELVPTASNLGTFGWSIPYAESLYHDDEVHGLFSDNQSLSAFALKRSFASNSNPQINSAFCTIPTNALDEVCAADAEISDYGCQVSMYHKVGIVTPLAGYIVPTLGTPDFMKTQLVNRGGSDLC